MEAATGAGSRDARTDARTNVRAQRRGRAHRQARRGALSGRGGLWRHRRRALEGVEEVEASLAASARGRKREALLERSAGWAAEALRLADVVYRQGLSSLIERLEAEAVWLGARLELVTAREKGFSAAVALHKALGRTGRAGARGIRRCGRRSSWSPHASPTRPVAPSRGRFWRRPHPPAMARWTGDEVTDGG